MINLDKNYFINNIYHNKEDNINDAKKNKPVDFKEEDELLKIANLPDFVELGEKQCNMVWKFR